MIINPIIPGFNPDPSIIRVENEYFIAVSSFEWFPGVPIYHSFDMVNWELLDHPLNTVEKLDLRGEMPSCGVWAPSLSYDNKQKRFYLLYSNVRSHNPYYFDVENFLIWTDDIHQGNWSNPLYINSSGFDASLFHDEDGCKWIVNKDRDFRPDNMDKRNIIIQELDIDKGLLIGKPVAISHGVTERRFVEAPLICKRNDYYYLIMAEGGTGYGHCVTIARSQTITGPYEASPYNPLLTSQPENFTASEREPFIMYHRYNPQADLQKSGHGSLVETNTGEWYMAHLCARPLMPSKRCVLGRETALQKVIWTDDDWLRMTDGDNVAKGQVAAPTLPEHPFAIPPERCEFKDSATLPNYFYTPRVPATEDWVSLKEDGLHIRGRESLTSCFEPSLIARKLTAFSTQTTAKMHYQPSSYHHVAGLTAFYDANTYYTVMKTCDDEGKVYLSIASFIEKKMTLFPERIWVNKNAPVWLRIQTHNADIQFLYSLDGETYHSLGKQLDLTLLSDEAGMGGKFTGAFVGMFAQDTDRKAEWVAFEWFEYRTMDDERKSTTKEIGR